MSTLEEEIVQKKFQDEYQKALINLIYTHNQIVDQLNLTFKPFKITRQQYNVLRILRGQSPKPATINLIKERMLDKMSDASRIVERLRVKGLIIRSQSEDDRRSVEVKISQKGLDLLEKLDPNVQGFIKTFTKLSEKEIRQLNELLDKLRS
jgi:DNA-binding MarR family transcriptional regulator